MCYLLAPVFQSTGYCAVMAGLLPFRDINVHASNSHYAFTSPSSPSSPTLVIERPSGDLRLNDGSLLGAKRVSSIAGILGIIKLKLGQYAIVRNGRKKLTIIDRQVRYRHYQSAARGPLKRAYDIQDCRG